MKRYLSDFMPAALVRDMRRSWRSHGYVAMLVLALLAAVWVQYDAVQEAKKSMQLGGGGILLLIGAVLMWFVIPNRAGAAVSADSGVKGTNFMMLTPLSSRIIVWGTWFSALVQLLLVAGVGALILWWRIEATPVVQPLPAVNPIDSLGRVVAPAVSPQLTVAQQWTGYGLMVGVGVLMCAVFLYLAQLSRFFRLAAAAVVLMNVIGWLVKNYLTMDWLLVPSYNPLADWLDGFTGYSLILRSADALLLLWALLELARRSYAAPAENCSRAVRLLALLPVVSVPLLVYLLPEEHELVKEQIYFSACFCGLVCLSDALLPTYALPAHSRRAWRLLPAYLQTPGVGQAAFYAVLMLVLNWGGAIWQTYQSGMSPDNSYFAEFCLSPQTTIEAVALYSGLNYLNLASLLLLALLLTDVLCRRTNPNRPVFCAVLVIVVGAVFGILGSSLILDAMPIQESVRPYIVAALPGTGGIDVRMLMGHECNMWLLSVCCGVSGAVVLLLLALLMLRRNQ